MSGLRSIVASEDPQLRARLREVLSGTDVQIVREVANSEEALLASTTERVDVAIVHHGLPGISGSVLADLLRQMERPVRSIVVHDGDLGPDRPDALDTTRPGFEANLLAALGVEGGRRPVRIVVVDDHEMVRRGIRALADEEPDIEFVAEAERADEALAAIEETRPDVAILDVRLPGVDGVELCREVRSRYPDVKCLMFTAHADDQALLNAILAGASGYVLKDRVGEDLVDAVKAIASGRSLLDAVASQSVIGLSRVSPAHPEPQLSGQQRRVLDLIVEGLTNREIAERLDLAEKTVKNYVSAILEKLKLRSRTQAAVYGSKLQDTEGDAPPTDG